MSEPAIVSLQERLAPRMHAARRSPGRAAAVLVSTPEIGPGPTTSPAGRAGPGSRETMELDAERETTCRAPVNPFGVEAKPMQPSRVQLAALLAALLAGCGESIDNTEGVGCEPSTYDTMVLESIEDPELTMIRDGYADADARCDAACGQIYVQTHPGEAYLVKTCEATAPDDAADPWDPSQTTVKITCTVEVTVLAGCGRRPHGHRELDAGRPSATAWLRLQAYLERASVVAFDELGAWLDDRGAPPALIQRCREAAADEVVHADLFDALLRREGLEPAALVTDRRAPSLLEVALHNASEGCVAESFGALLGAYQAQHADDRELRAIFGRLARDEVRHGQLAWDLHFYWFDELDATAQALVVARMEEALDVLPQRVRAEARMAPSGLGWPPPDEAEALARAFVAGLRASLGPRVAA